MAEWSWITGVTPEKSAMPISRNVCEMEIFTGTGSWLPGSVSVVVLASFRSDPYCKEHYQI